MPQLFDPEILVQRGMTCRELSLRADSVNEEKRTFEAVVATEQPVAVFDFRTFDIVDEILIARGGEFPERVPLLPNHERSSVLDVIGSARDFRLKGREWIGRGFVAFPEGEGDPVQRIWRRVADGHLRAVSIGYQVRNYTDIPAGETRRVARREFTAGERTLRVSTEWQGLELSLTPIGADPNALIRTKHGHLPTTKKKRSYFR